MSKLTKARNAIGGLSKPSKMPGAAYSLPAKECLTGSQLRHIKNSVCANCYALKGRYAFPNVQAALYRRLETISDPEWSTNMAIAINGQPWFRWHDSGDLQSVDHLQKIVEVCRATPTTRHWLPTRERDIIRQYLKTDTLPDNLTVRLSATMIDGVPPSMPGINTSTVHKQNDAIGYACPAPKQGNKCRDCRACWDKTVKNVSYHAH